MQVDQIIQENSHLPIVDVLGEVSSALQDVNLVIVKAPPGAGKTTLLPLSLLPMLDEGDSFSKMLVLEPRRMATKTAAERMSSLLGECVGQTVGYKMRQESKCSRQGKIEVITEGLLARMLNDDPSLEDVSVVIFDEFHERSLNNDLSLALCLQINQLYREDNPLKLIVMSASLDGIAFDKLNQPMKVIESLGKQYPVEMHYQNTALDIHLDMDVVGRILLQALNEHEGGVLIFLPGRREVEQCLSWIENSHSPVFDECKSLPLYGALNIEQQMQAIKPLSTSDNALRKIVASTDVAEASLTIADIAIVIDTGLCRIPNFDLKSGFTRLETKRISQASSTQRAGRAGRTQPGVCYRLWPESQQQSLSKQQAPEILQADLSQLMLQLYHFGEVDVNAYEWVDTPRLAQVAQALDLLSGLGAINEEGNGLSDMGVAMNVLPAHPRISNMLLHVIMAPKPIQNMAAAIASLLQEANVMPELGFNLTEKVLRLLNSSSSKSKLSKVKRIQKQQDQYIKTLNNLKDQFEKDVLDRLSENSKHSLQSLERLGDEREMIAYLLSLAYPDRIAKPIGDGRYKLSNGKTAKLFDSLPDDKWLIIAECGGLKGSADMSIFSASVFSEDSFYAMYSDEIEKVSQLKWYEQDQSIRAEELTRFRQLNLKRKNISINDLGGLESLWVNLIETKGFEFLPIGESAVKFLDRVDVLLSFGEFSDQAFCQRLTVLSQKSLIDNISEWLVPFLQNVKSYKQLADLDWLSMLKSQLKWDDQQLLDKYCPERFSVPSGSQIKIDYSQSPPVLAVKLQEMFGTAQPPTIALGQVALSVHLLSPAGKPLQITQDLAAFWQGAYEDVKKEMKGRYPKHPWPDDPVNAQATFLTKRKLQQSQE